MNMKKALYVALIVALFATLMPSGAEAAQSDLVRFRFENRSATEIALRLYSQDGSGRAYYMVVESKSSKVMTPPAGVYDYRLTSCGVIVHGEIELIRNHNWVLPTCGSKGGAGTKAGHTKDVSEIVRLVKVDLVNESSTRILLLLYGPYDYVFEIEGKATKVVTILKGTYDYTLFACYLGVYTGSFHARANKIEEFDCQ